MTEHTKGPWSWDAGDIGQETSVPYCNVFKDDGDLIIASVNDRFSLKEGRANARLIAAAPDMFKACHKALGVMSDLYDPLRMSEEDHQKAADLADMLNAALFKAERG